MEEFRRELEKRKTHRALLDARANQELLSSLLDV